ncbi:uncharacterized protein LOC141668253 isoform X1 [Apium graveolens]|uniref:uncharacterized protein LOC141668253 isoform X1 n=1 Tax=Apium graveolens TaxID=4045 RepID=UPI003D79CE44
MFLENGLYKWGQLVLQSRVRHVYRNHLMRVSAINLIWNSYAGFVQNQTAVQPAAQRGLSRCVIASDSDLISDIVPPSGQTPDLGKLEVIIVKAMASGKDSADEKHAFGKGWDSGKMLQLCIYDRMKKKGLHNAAEMFAKEVNLAMVEFVNFEEGLLQEWWEVFWPQFCSRKTNIDEEAERSEQTPIGFEEGPLGLSPAQLLMTEITLVPPSGNASHQQMPATLLASPQFVKVLGTDVSGEGSVQMGSTCPAEQGSTCLPAASNAGFSHQFNME